MMPDSLRDDAVRAQNSAGVVPSPDYAHAGPAHLTASFVPLQYQTRLFNKVIPRLPGPGLARLWQLHAEAPGHARKCSSRRGGAEHASPGPGPSHTRVAPEISHRVRRARVLAHRAADGLTMLLGALP